MGDLHREPSNTRISCFLFFSFLGTDTLLLELLVGQILDLPMGNLRKGGP